MFFRHVVRVTLAATFPALAAAQGAGERARDTLAAAVITATRVAVSTVAPTATTTVLRGNELRAQGITRVADALRLVPGATILGSGPIGSQTSLFLRGGNSGYVRVLVDGVPVNDAGGFFDLANLTTSNIDRIEVVRGPVSVLYGSDAVSGVIQLFTRDGHGPASLRVLAGGGSEGAQRLEVGLSGGSARAGYTLDGSRQATDGILPFNNRYTNDVLSGSVRVVPDARSDARISARWSGVVYHYPTDYSGAVVDHNSEQVDHRLVASVDAGRRLTDRVELRTTLASNEFLPRSNDGRDDSADTLGFYGYFSRSVRTRRSADSRLNVRMGARHTLTVGADLARDRERTTSLSQSEFGDSNDGFEASRHNTGLYAQMIGDANDRWSYAVGARHDDNSAFGSFETGRASIAFLANASARFRAAIGSAFKAPSFYENFATGFVVGNPALKPEESRSAELGFDAFLADGALTLSAVGYAQRFRNIVQYTGTAPSPGAPNYYNVAEADANGVELEARWRVSDRLAVSGNYGYLATRVTQTGFDSSAGASYVKGEALIRRPPHSFAASISQGFGSTGSVSIVATRVGERGDRDFTQFPTAPVTLPAHVRVDLSGAIPTGLRGLSAVVRIDNLFDTKYEDIVRFAAPGRAVFAGLQLAR